MLVKCELSVIITLGDTYADLTIPEALLEEFNKALSGEEKESIYAEMIKKLKDIGTNPRANSIRFKKGKLIQVHLMLTELHISINYVTPPDVLALGAVIKQTKFKTTCYGVFSYYKRLNSNKVITGEEMGKEWSNTDPIIKEMCKRKAEYINSLELEYYCVSDVKGYVFEALFFGQAHGKKGVYYMKNPYEYNNILSLKEGKLVELDACDLDILYNSKYDLNEKF